MTGITWFVDLDNTLIDHDRFKADIGAWVAEHVSPEAEAFFWSEYEAVRRETSIVDLPETARRFARSGAWPGIEAALLEFLWGYRFADLLYPGALEALEDLGRLGRAVILCDGHEAFQRHKLQQTGVAGLVGGRIEVCIHKEREIAGVTGRYPARHYVMIDDKPRIHAALKAELRDTVTTVLIEQGHYARAASAHPPGVDHRVASIAAIPPIAGSVAARIALTPPVR